MRVRDHVALSTAGALLCYPVLRRRVLLPWTVSILLDVDHYLWFAVRARTLNLRTALRYFNGAQPAHTSGTRVFHSPLVLIAAWLAVPRPVRYGAIGGAVVHVSLDLLHERRLASARQRTLARDGSTCQHCGRTGPEVVAHQTWQPFLFPAYDVAHFTSLCTACHEEAHTQPMSLSNQDRFPVSVPSSRAELVLAEGATP